MTDDLELLTEEEQCVIQSAGALWVLLCQITDDGPSRHHDLAELAAHIHAIQNAVMAQAAARAYPQVYRLLGAGPPPTPGPIPAQPPP